MSLPTNAAGRAHSEDGSALGGQAPHSEDGHCTVLAGTEARFGS
jgi:hypothetical protein